MTFKRTDNGSATRSQRPTSADKNDTATRISREITAAETRARDTKTERLRKLREQRDKSE